MAKRKEHEKDSHQALLKLVSDELESAKRSQDPLHEKFEDYYKMLHCERLSELEDVDSDIFLPEFVSRVLSIIGDFVARYFQSRDFVETRTTSEDPKDVMEAKASKTLLNNLLSDDKLYYFQKVVRLLMFVIVCGYGVIKGGYRQEFKRTKTGTRQVEDYVYDEEGNALDEIGNVYTGNELQVPQKTMREEEAFIDELVDDRPDFDVYPIDDVYFSSEYAYSLRDKKWVIFRTYQTIGELRRDQQICGYIESALKELERLDRESQTKADSPKKNKFIQDYIPEDEEATPHFVRTYKVYERYGKAYYDPETGGPGVDKDGAPTSKAVLEECIISWVATGIGDTPELLIRFQKSPFSVRPAVRFNCYIDSSNDLGFGDGEPVRELQIAANDTFNISNFRTMLATTPAFKGKKYQNIPNKIKISPRSVTFLDNIEDLAELEIKDNIQGAMVQLGMLRQSINEVMASSSIDQGIAPENRETATMGSILAQKSSIRSGLRTASIEFSGFTELYQMMLALCNDFMLPETLEGLIGKDLAYAYNPKRKDRFYPVSQALETEDSKQFKIKMWDQILGRVVAVPNPKTPTVINYILGQILETMGGEFKTFKNFMFDEDPLSVALYQIATGSKGGGMAPTANMGGMQGGTNQMGIQPGAAEQATRDNMNMAS